MAILSSIATTALRTVDSPRRRNSLVALSRIGSSVRRALPTPPSRRPSSTIMESTMKATDASLHTSSSTVSSPDDEREDADGGHSARGEGEREASSLASRKGEDGGEDVDDVEEVESDCPLCLCPLEQYDHAHPLQCPSRHCQFNSCIDCLEQLIKSTAESVEASDGNTFKVLLHCPNCRSNLGPSIRDTVLLRKVDKCSIAAHLNTDDGVEIVDEQLSASELRFKYALEKDATVSIAIEEARRREDDFFGRDDDDDDGGEDIYQGDLSLLSKSLSGSAGSRVWSFDDEEGLEADFVNGPHNSFIFRHHSMVDIEDDDDSDREDDRAKGVDAIQVDTTLLQGLEAFMTEQEQQFITAHLISGEPGRLAVATEMMHYVSALSRQGMRPSVRRQQQSQTHLLERRRSGTTGMLDSIKEVIREGNEARRLEEEGTACTAAGAQAAQLSIAGRRTVKFAGVAEGRKNMKRAVEIETKRRMEYMELHPLPLRMPKYAEVTKAQAQSVKLTFVEDVWDGTVLDAFSKITVTTSLLGQVSVSKQEADAAGVGVRSVIEAGMIKSPRYARSPKSAAKGYIDTFRPRVIVASISREMGQQGIVKGDVVTHFNGEQFVGDVERLMELIERRDEDEMLTFVFNADSAVAEALKWRSKIP